MCLCYFFVPSYFFLHVFFFLILLCRYSFRFLCLLLPLSSFYFSLSSFSRPFTFYFLWIIPYSLFAPFSYFCLYLVSFPLVFLFVSRFLVRSLGHFAQRRCSHYKDSSIQVSVVAALVLALQPFIFTHFTLTYLHCPSDTEHRGQSISVTRQPSLLLKPSWYCHFTIKILPLLISHHLWCCSVIF
jgi:hypothetical protein